MNLCGTCNKEITHYHGSTTTTYIQWSCTPPRGCGEWYLVYYHVKCEPKWVKHKECSGKKTPKFDFSEFFKKSTYEGS